MSPQQLQQSAGRSRLAFGIAAIVVPLALGLLFARQNARLRALADHGREAQATIASVTTDAHGTWVDYRYDVDGVTHTWNVARKTLGGEAGTRFPVTYLPEDPSLSRPGTYTTAAMTAELGLGFQRNVLAGLFVFFAAFAVWSHGRLVRLRAGAVEVRKPIAPETLGRILASLFLAVGASVELDPSVRKVQVALLGEHPLGLSAWLVAVVIETALFAPLWWVMPQLVRIVMAHQARGGSTTKAGIVVAVVNAEPELRYAQRTVIAGAVYFAILFGAWIAYASYRGV